MRVIVHAKDFLPMYNLLKANKQKNKAMLDAIENIQRQLENSDRPLGIHHKIDNIPQKYKLRYNLSALYHFEMPDGHRLMYTVGSYLHDDNRDVMFLELLTHDEYNKLFGYFKKRSH